MDKKFFIPPEGNRPETTVRSLAERKTDRRKVLAIIFGSAAIAALYKTEKIKKSGKPLLEELVKFFQKRKSEEISEEKTTEVKEEVAESKDNKKEIIDLENLSAQELADKMIEVSGELYRKEDILPKNLINEDLIDAIELRESGGLEKNSYMNEGIENSGAFGVMQLRENTIRDVIEQLHRLVDYKEITPHTSLESTDKLEKLKEIIKMSESHGRAFGSLYIAMLYKVYGIGKDKYEKGDIIGTQKEIASAYKEGPTLVGENPNFVNTKKAKGYYERPLRHLDLLKEVKIGIDAIKFKTDKRELARQITLELDRYRNLRNNKSIQKKLMLEYLKKIKEMEDRIGRELKQSEIKNSIEVFNSRGIRFNAEYIATNKKKAT